MAEDPRLVVLYQKMSEHTSPECAKTCRVPHSCCNAFDCGLVKDYAKEKHGIDLVPTGHPTIPFMSETGCIVKPHLRPHCTMHTCQINGLGFKPGDPEWTEEYFKLRFKIEEIEGETY